MMEPSIRRAVYRQANDWLTHQSVDFRHPGKGSLPSSVSVRLRAFGRVGGAVHTLNKEESA